jgi:hypothetical protein
MIKVKKGAVICGACRLRHYKCRPCSDRQHRAPGEITMLFSIKVLYLTIDGMTINLYPLRLHIQHCE